jgi:hypothetical protein
LFEDVWNNTPSSWLSVEASGVDLSIQVNSGYSAYNVPGGSGTITYQYTIEEEGFLCLDVNMYARNFFYVYLNGQYLFSESMTLPQTIAVSQVKPGDVVELKILCKAGENSSMNIHAALLNDALFRQGYDILNASTLRLTEFSTTRVEGIINCNRDGLLYTSIPQDGNWKAVVDGEKVEPVLVGDAMIGLNLTKGSHEIVFVYENTAFTYGTLISVVCLLAFLALIYLNDREKWNERAMRIYRFIKKK